VVQSVAVVGMAQRYEPPPTKPGPDPLYSK
jgi:hypothetical protein